MASSTPSHPHRASTQPEFHTASSSSSDTDNFDSEPPSVSASASSSSFLGSSIYSAFTGLTRRFSSDPAGNMLPSQQHTHSQQNSSHSLGHPSNTNNNGVTGVFTPPIHRTASPMRPPPLDPLMLRGFREDTPSSARLLTSAIAEEIRIMVPERLRIEEDWRLVYSLDQDGASLATLYQKCQAYEGRRGGFVLVVRDDEGGIFGAYLSEYLRPSSHYFGTGECFLWRTSQQVSLPPLPSEDTTNLTVRASTIASPTANSFPPLIPELADETGQQPPPIIVAAPPTPKPPTTSSLSSLPASKPAAQRLSVHSVATSMRFKAFPYSGVNEYYMYCEPHALSVGGGDGKYGLWLDDGLEKGVSSTCLTFGNEPLSDQGDKFGVLGVEVWVIGSKGV